MQNCRFRRPRPFTLHRHGQPAKRSSGRISAAPIPPMQCCPSIPMAMRPTTRWTRMISRSTPGSRAKRVAGAGICPAPMARTGRRTALRRASTPPWAMQVQPNSGPSPRNSRNGPTISTFPRAWTSAWPSRSKSPSAPSIATSASRPLPATRKPMLTAFTNIPPARRWPAAMPPSARKARSFSRPRMPQS